VNKKIAAGVLAGLLAGGAAGVALGVPTLSGAQESPTTTAPAESTPTDPATDAARPERGQWVADALAPLVADQVITQAQADAVAAALEAAKPARGDGGPGMRGGRGLDSAATALGITADELRTALEGGQSIADVAAANGVDVQVVVDAMLADLKTHLDEEVAAGEHTQEEADAKLAAATERITAMVNGELPAGGPQGMGRHGHGPGGFGRGAEAPAEGTGTSTSA
jgi:hypothetical protein